MTNAILRGKPDAGNPHVRIRKIGSLVCITALGVASAFAETEYRYLPGGYTQVTAARPAQWTSAATKPHRA